MACAPNKDSDQPGHPPSLIRVFAVRMKKAWVLSYALSGQWRLWSDWADAQADLSLHWAHMPFCWFCHEAAHFYCSQIIRAALCKWAASWQNQQNDYAQSDQRLRCALSGKLRTQAFFMRTAKTLIRLGGCPSWSESLLGTQSLCWFCHDAAYILCTDSLNHVHQYRRNVDLCSCKWHTALIWANLFLLSDRVILTQWLILRR